MEAYTDQALTNFSQLWKNEDGSLIIPKLLPRIQVEKNSGSFPIWGKEALVIQTDLLRTGKSKTREIGITRKTGTWGPLQERALKMFIEKDQYRLYPSVFDTESAAVMVIKEQMALAEEYAGVQTLTSTTVIPNYTTLSTGSKFTDAAVNPTDTIINAVKEYRKKAFGMPNTLAMGFDAFVAICQHPKVIEMFKYVQPALIGKNELLSILGKWGITNIEVGTAMGTLKDLEDASAAVTTVDLWGDDVLLTKVTSRPELQSVNGGYTLEVAGEAYVDKWDEKDPKGTYVRQNDYYDQVIFSTDVYYLIKDVL